MHTSGMLAEFIGGLHWRVWHGVAAVDVAGPAWPAAASELSTFVDEICARNGERCGVRTVILLVPDSYSAGPIRVASYPRHVWAVSTNRAIAHGLEQDPPFVVVDASGAATLHIGESDTRIAEPEPERVSELMRALNVTRLLVPRGASGLPSRIRARCSTSADVIEYGPDAIRSGATRFAAGLMEQSGVWTTSERTIWVRGKQDVAYPIHRTRYGAFDDKDLSLAEVVQGAPVLLACDRNVEAIYGDAIRAYARRHLNVMATVTMDGCEVAKSMAQVEEICRIAAHACLPRKGVVVAVGGGVTLDIAGTAASLFRRGVSFVRVPTTLIGLVDVAVGIKQGVNAFGRKNILGSFFPPLASINDYGFVQTSPGRSISCGLAEIVKMALIRDERLLDAVEEHGQELLYSRFQRPAAVAQSVTWRAETLMMEELAPNLFETDLARLVDFGHTFSPTIESASGYRIAHGEAVALDMLMSTSIAISKRLCLPDVGTRLIRLWPLLGLPVWHREVPSPEELMSALDGVKAHRGGKLNLVVPIRAGAAAFVQNVSLSELGAALEWMQSNASQSRPVSCKQDRYASTRI